MEELEGALSEKGLKFSTDPQKGRCLFTIQDFSPGEVIISQEPYVSVPTKTKSEPLPKCEWCFTSSNVKKCSSCQVVYYCGQLCQKSDWKLHRIECQALLKVERDKIKSLAPTLRLMIKLYIRKKLQSENNIPTTAMDNYTLLEALVSHMSDIDGEKLVLYAQMANLANMILRWTDTNIKEIAENFCKFACNAHTICDSELKPLGTGIYPVISMINHSCAPNSVLVFEGRIAVVRALQYIKKGTEVCISYIETAGSTTTRLKALKEQYFFSCNCLRCEKMGQIDDIQESAVLEGYRCKDGGCEGFLLRDAEDKGFICQQCGLLREKEEVKSIVIDIKSLLDRASLSLSSGHQKDAIVLYKMIQELELKLYHPFSLNLMGTRENLLKIFMELQDWKAALSYCRLTLPVYQRVYQGIHPLLGLQYYTCGKLEWWLGESEEAFESLTKAMDILQITHGTKTPFMKELSFRLEEARAEISYKLSTMRD